MSNKSKCIFNDSWLTDSRFSKWLKKSHAKSKAYCNLCGKDFDISNMGISALNSHSVGKKQKDQESRDSNSIVFFRTAIKSSSSQSSQSMNKKTVESMIVPASALRVEILWTLKVSISHFSLRSCLGLNELFKMELLIKANKIQVPRCFSYLF